MDIYTYTVQERERPQSRRPSARAGMASGADMMQQWSAMYAPYMESMDRMMRGMMAPWLEAMGTAYESYQRPSYGRKHNCDCGHCPDCAPDVCHCLCCIGDADLVIYARLGEQRVVPIEIENSRRREREIRLELSGWSTRRGKPAEGIVSAIFPPTEFTLGPCQRHETILVVGSTGAAQDTMAALKKATEAQRDDDIPRLPDVDECEVFYADLRVEGCEIRPIRIALALLPRDCDPYQIECGCHCC